MFTIIIITFKENRGAAHARAVKATKRSLYFVSMVINLATMLSSIDQHSFILSYINGNFEVLNKVFFILKFLIYHFALIL